MKTKTSLSHRILSFPFSLKPRALSLKLLFISVFIFAFSLEPSASSLVYAASKGNPAVVFAQYSSSEVERSETESRSSRLTSFARTILDWLCSPAYAASKGADPVAYWRFDEGGGPTAYDESANNNDGTLVNHAKFVPGKIGKALQFDGTDDYVSTTAPASIGTSGDFSVSAWFKTSTSNKPIVHVDYGNHTWGRWSIRSGLVSLYGGGSSPSYKQISISGYENGVFNHIVVVFSRSDSKIYVYMNGSFYNSLTWDGFIEGQGTSPLIGAQLVGGSGGYFNGTIDDVKIYNYARTADQVMV
ncbi:MAG: LamG domain-containing protein, partial [Candidatus Omnitrophota bacterium]|nr:LamG domain-containing protein [Candidatus Omnitrophota bacterium]